MISTSISKQPSCEEVSVCRTKLLNFLISTNVEPEDFNELNLYQQAAQLRRGKCVSNKDIQVDFLKY